MSDLAPIKLGRDICNDLGAAERREWWLANGRGGYAGGTVAGSLTRRYHGLLIAPIDPPLGRVLVLAKADATATIDGQAYPLFTNRWASGAIAPDGYRLIEEFRARRHDPVLALPLWRAGRRAAHLDGAGRRHGLRRLALRHTGDPVGHSSRQWPRPSRRHLARRVPAGDRGGGRPADCRVPGRFALTLVATGGEIAPRRGWYWDFDLPVERERGLGDRDAHLHVGDLSLRLEPGRWAGFAAGLSAVSADLDAALARRLAHDRAAVPAAFATAPDWVRRLALAADAFLVARPLAGSRTEIGDRRLSAGSAIGAATR